MQSPIVPGDVVRVRGRLWRVRSSLAHADCISLDLESAEPDAARAPERVVLLTPFDRPVALKARAALRVVTRRAWFSRLRQTVAAHHDPATLAAPARAAIDLLPHQLEPALAVVCHGVSRLLLADGVGLGKTIEAGLVLAELQARGELDRALVVTPPGLRDQWAAELRRRFDIEAEVADAAWLRARRSEFPASINPWAIPGVRIASVDFVKRPEVRRSLEEVFWDALVLDEAHTAAGDSDRRAAVHAFATMSRRVLLLTATPHAGDQASFDALCRIGALDGDDRIALFRRSRSDVGMRRTRRVHLLRVRMSAAEAAVHATLREYARQVWTARTGPEGRHARLAMIVLIKRSLSGMAPLLRSLTSRLSRLGATPEPPDAQLPLPWEDETDRADEMPGELLGPPGLPDLADERARLDALAAAAQSADCSDSKRRALGRLLGRTRCPVIVFTEYRDTLASLAACLPDGDRAAELHGGLNRAERAEALRRFADGEARVLLATDAAGEGLNLQERCSLVVNLELPWNPMRLEQRIGRVDRIGQTRVVHAINLLARGTVEAGVLARLIARLDRAQAAVGSVDSVLGHSDEAVTERWLGIEGAPPWKVLRAPLIARTDRAPMMRRVDLHAAAEALCGELEWRRSLWRADVARRRPCHDRDAAEGLRMNLAVACAPRRRLPAPLNAGGALAVVGVNGRIVPVFVGASMPRLHTRAAVRGAARAFLSTWGPSLLGAARVAGDSGLSGKSVPASRRRERGWPAQAGLMQDGLFDRRAERARAQRRRDCGPDEPKPVAGNDAVGPPEGEPDVRLLLLITS